MNCCEVNPLVVIVAVSEVYSALIQLMNDSQNPNFCNVANRKDQLTLSNAFCASNERIMVSVFFLFESCIRLNNFRVF